jgi:hypothetical protein
MLPPSMCSRVGWELNILEHLFSCAHGQGKSLRVGLLVWVFVCAVCLWLKTPRYSSSLPLGDRAIPHRYIRSRYIFLPVISSETTWDAPLGLLGLCNLL